MALDSFFLEYWYFHIPNYILSVLVWTLVGRFALGLFLPPDHPNYIWRFFRRLTDPVLRAGAWVIPSAIPPAFQPLAAAVHLLLLRLVFWIALAANGLAPRVTPGPG